jgi:hypothetical protein
MGTYTELVLKCTLKKESSIPPDVLNILKYLFRDRVEIKDTAIPNHPFFSCPHWRAIGYMNSVYHIPETFNFFEGNKIFSRSDTKNYDSEIELFIDWLLPYLDHQTGDCIGWVWHEELLKPKLIKYIKSGMKIKN